MDKVKNSDSPANPLVYADLSANGGREIYCSDVGLTKREMFCLHHGVADTGDAELDAIITKGNKQKAAIAAMQGLLVNAGRNGLTIEGSHTQAAFCAESLINLIDLRF